MGAGVLPLRFRLKEKTHWARLPDALPKSTERIMARANAPPGLRGRRPFEIPSCLV
jgi:hypothetical protein